MARKEKNYNYIYKTTNLKNGKFYVGMHSTDNLNDGYLGSGTRLRRSIRRNGIENFKIEYLEFFDNRIDLINRETQLVNEDLLKDPMCINLKNGGEGGCQGVAAMKWSKAGIARRKWLFENDKEWLDRYIELHRQSSLKNPKGVALTKEGGGKYWVGRKHKKESKLKIGQSNSIKQKGENNSQFGTCWITNGTENKKIKKTYEIPKGWELGRK
jgi:hypothetical protein